MRKSCRSQNNQWRRVELRSRGCHGRDGMVVGFTTTYAIRVYDH
jgi:hypothetical protein